VKRDGRTVKEKGGRSKKTANKPGGGGDRNDQAPKTTTAEIARNERV